MGNRALLKKALPLVIAGTLSLNAFAKRSPMAEQPPQSRAAQLEQLKSEGDSLLKSVRGLKGKMDLDRKLFDSLSTIAPSDRVEKSLDKYRHVKNTIKAIHLANESESCSQKGEHGKAIRLATGLVQLEPNASQSYCIRGHAYYASSGNPFSKRADSALADFEKAIALAKTEAEYSAARGARDMVRRARDDHLLFGTVFGLMGSLALAGILMALARRQEERAKQSRRA